MKRMYNLAPGNILQNMYLKKRIKLLLKNKKIKFIELGSGNGNISNILLRFGLEGIGFDLNEEACKINGEINNKYISGGKYKVYNSDFFEYIRDEKINLIISSHVIEHLSDEDLNSYFEKCKDILPNDGIIISLVPSGMKYWGIEDETAGHYRRFEYEDFIEIGNRYELKINNIVGLTYPLSNFLLGISNYLIKKNDGWKKNLTKEEQTKLSSSGGAKQIKYKTTFPYWFKYIINEITMYPFYLLQNMFKTNKKSMIIYCEYINGGLNE